jgi:hypothetical protein
MAYTRMRYTASISQPAKFAAEIVGTHRIYLRRDIYHSSHTRGIFPSASSPRIFCIAESFQRILVMLHLETVPPSGIRIFFFEPAILQAILKLL